MTQAVSPELIVLSKAYPFRGPGPHQKRRNPELEGHESKACAMRGRGPTGPVSA